jgi:hypothetical protein
MDNPWLNISWNNTIADIDKPYIIQKYGSIEAFEKKYDSVGLNFHQCLPDPYSGNIKSKVYCLNKNPGEPDKCFIHNADFEKSTRENLELKKTTCFWAEDIKNKCGKVHDGIGWLKKRTRKLETILNRRPNIFFVEFFPYHSSIGFDFPSNLPSYRFTDELIAQAMKEEKMIIIMREKGNWIKRVPDLVSYSNLFCLKCAQGGYLTLNNIVRYSKGNEGPNITESEIKSFF